MAKPTILMIGNYLSQPKHNRNIWNDLSERLAGAGWGVITTSRQENKVLRLLDMLQTILFKRKQYALAQIDVFSGAAFTFARSCAWLLRLLKKPYVLTLHGGGLPVFARKHPDRIKRLLSTASAVTTPSPFLQVSLADFRNDILCIPNPVQISSMGYRKRAHLTPNLIWIRAFHEIYNPGLAVRMIKILSQSMPECKLTMIGPDKGDGSFEKVLLLTHEFGLDNQIRVLPGIPSSEVPVLLDTADIFINTTNYDTFPRSLIEAMACGLCVVSTNVGGIPWLVNNGQEGFLVSPDDPQVMADAVLSLLNNPELAERISTQARQKAETLDWSAILPQWEALLSSVGISGNDE